MLKTKNLVPEVYYRDSRDFQFFGRVFEVLFNYAKMNSDLMVGLPLSQNLDDSLVQLLATTLGFTTKHQYNTADLKAICSTFNLLLKNKGSRISIEDACKTLMNVQNTSTSYIEVQEDYAMEGDEEVRTYCLNIYIPEDLTDLVLIEDIFDYILPAGWDYRFIKAFNSGEPNKSSFYSESSIKAFKVTDFSASRITIPGTDGRNDLRPADTRLTTNDPEFGLTYTGKVFTPIDEE